MNHKVQDDGVYCQTTTLVSNHGLKDCQCTHTNVVKVIGLQKQQEYETPMITITSAQQYDNLIIKTTEIKYKRTKYIIQDHYLFDLDSKPISQISLNDFSVFSSLQNPKSDDQSIKREIQHEKNKQKKLCFFHKLPTTGKTLLKRNTKNLPKNFFKGFLSFIQTQNFKQNCKMILKQLKQLNSGQKYNNILIQKMLSSTNIAPYFKQFLENHAQKWINCSKINDKSIHLEAIPIYLSLFDKFAYAEEDKYESDQ